MVKKYKILEVSNVTRILFNASVVIKEKYSKQTLCRDHVGLHSRFQFSFLLLTKKKILFSLFAHNIPNFQSAFRRQWAWPELKSHRGEATLQIVKRNIHI